MTVLPRWIDVFLIPLINLCLALIVSGLVVLTIGEDPFRAMQVLVTGATRGSYEIGFTLFYATSFIFTGLAVAVAFHASQFNIGGEGQAGLGGLGVALVALYMDWSHWAIVFPLAIVGGALFGAAWAAIPAYLQARRGSHIVITTIMFNYIGASLLGYLLVYVLKVPGSQVPESRRFEDAAHLPTIQEIAALFGGKLANTPLNISFFWALICAFGVWWLIWRTKFGYEVRSFGHSPSAARYGGISAFRITMLIMLLSGALAGMMALNVVTGSSHKLVNDPIQGFGFVGIAVALMGRSHPVGVVFAAILFGMLYQGGTELQFEMGIPVQMVLVIQALVILFVGALEHMVRGPVTKVYLGMQRGAA